MPPIPPPGAGAGFVLLREFGDESFGGEKQSADGRGVLQCAAGDLGGIDDAGFDEVFIIVRCHVVAFVAFALFDFLHDECAFLAGVVGQLRRGASTARRTIAAPMASSPLEFEVVESLLGADESDTAAGDDAFFHGRTGRVKGVFDAGFFLFHLGFGCGADVDDGNTTGELGEALLELLAVVIRGGFLDLTADLGDAALDVTAFALPSTIVVFSLSTVMRLACRGLLMSMFSSLMPRSSVMQRPPVRVAMSSSMALRRSPKPGALTAQICRVPRSLLTTRVASASPSTSSAMMRSGRPDLADFLEQREEVLEAADFFLVDEDVGVVELGFHASALVTK
jgi:hypothetical protein